MMIKMRKTFVFINSLFLSLSLSLFFALPSFAQVLDICPTSGGQANSFNPLCTSLTGTDAPKKIIGFVITLMFVIAVVLALFFLIWGGIKWILSGGDKGGVEAARNTIIAAVIGLAVTFAAYFILNVVIGFFLPGFSLSNISLPHL
jgi:hypothetical protein